MEVFFIAMALISLGVDIGNQIFADINQGKLNEIRRKYSREIKQLTDDLAKDQVLRNQLAEKLSNHQYNAAQSMLYRSPIGSKYQAALKKINDTENDLKNSIKKSDSEILSKNAELNRLNEELAEYESTAQRNGTGLVSSITTTANLNNKQGELKFDEKL